MSNPMNGLIGNQTLLEAKKLLQEYREGKEPPGTTEAQVNYTLSLLLETIILIMISTLRL